MEKQDINFQKLTPTNDVNMDIYENAMDYIFKHSDVKNIAISGAYGAGKSSLLESYKKKKKNLKFIHISLAHFNSFDIENKDDDDEKQENILEGKILNQLIHQIPSEEIPQTNFKVKQTINIKKISINIILLILVILLTMHIKYFRAWSSLVHSLSNNKVQKVLSYSTTNECILFSGVSLVIVIAIILFKLFKLQINDNLFRKINVQGNEIEIFKENNDSYFDKYLNEVLYIFERARVDVIVFEDIDRFNVNSIFERLREINILVNIKRESNKKKPIRFLYLLRDDIFISKDRTKFFDYIIPIIPVIDSSNSYNQFINYLKEGKIYNKFDKKFLQGISLYIDDMRILKNIYNEFIIYYNRLNNIELDCNKMLSMIVYKNLFPRDFSNLQINKGFVFTLFDNKENFQKNLIEENNNKIEMKKKEIQSYKEETLVSLDEIDCVYRWKHQNSNNWSERRKLEEWYETEGQKRKNIINEKSNIKISELEGELEELELKSNLIKQAELKDIINRNNVDIIFQTKSVNEIGQEESFNEIKTNDYFDLLKYLIRNGYINETYSDYMTYFYGNSINRIDKIFLRSISDKKAKEYGYKLCNPELVIEKLDDTDFTQQEILNFNLLDALLKNKKYDHYLVMFLRLLNKEKNLKFVAEYFDREIEIEYYVQKLNNQWPEMFSYAFKTNGLTNAQMKKYSIYSIYNSDNESLSNMNKDNSLSNYISKSNDYLNIVNPNIERIIYGLKLLNVLFDKIDFESSNKELLLAVYKENLYKLNYDNIYLFLREMYGIKNISEIIHKNYSLISSQKDSPLCKYVNENIEMYIEIILDVCKDLIEDNEDAVLSILNNKSISVDNKHRYINKLRTKITSISDISDSDIRLNLLDNLLVKYSLENTIKAFKEWKFNDSVVNYINSDEEKLDFSCVKDIYGDAVASKLFNTCIINNEISNEIYENMLGSLGIKCDTFTINTISKDKFDILVKLKIIPMSIVNLKFVRDNYAESTMSFIRENIVQYVDIMSEPNIIINEVTEILSWDLDSEVKIKLMKLTNKPISILEKAYSNDIIRYILENNLYEEDIPYLINAYDNYPSDIKNIILEIATNNIGYILEQPSEVSKSLIDDIMLSENVDRDSKIEILLDIIPCIDIELCAKYMVSLELPGFAKVFERNSRPRFEIDITNKKILAAYKKRGWIKEFEENPEKNGYYKVYR